ncbi:hypothetical protein PRIPAC_83047 [Pristionchus pacificus]|uniref:Uncharacterized protein n=1 Tax=Pristionchus pacificus TaxID=54126 RepID=A0A2A6C3K5_PRIPA|nr:hypothetical protein PRIPAC_83047 [Pristionchus pacificus]|eukprot:PDM72709.1 hypothetical protein PRIPAC_39143 [Pristionchus pacificus]
MILGKKEGKLYEENYENDVVYLFQFPGTKTSPSISPFSVKVEAFYRLHNIKYKKRNTILGRGTNGRLPFVELNGEIISDSQIIIRRLTEKMQLQAYQDAQSAAVGHTIDRMLDNHTFKTVHLCLIIHSKLDKLGALIERIALSNRVLESRVTTSIGSITEEQYKELLRNDVLQLQTILGKNKFLLGEEPTSFDCTALGQLGVAYYTTPSLRTSLHDLLDSDECTDLKKYVERRKESIYGIEFFYAHAKA